MVNKTGWVLHWYNSHPPYVYQLNLSEMNALFYHSDFFTSFIAAYNYGFQRGRNFEVNKRRKKNKK